MGGEIGIKGALGEGSTFWFTLPYKPLREGVEIIDEQSSNQHELKSVRKLIILVAEDNEINQVIIKALLEKMGHEVTFANNGYEAVDEVKVHDYDLILMDVRMPGLSGPDATIQIRQLDGYKADIPIIALTADMMADNRKSYFDAGMNDCVGKPINPEELAVAINNAVRASQDGDEQAISRPAFDFEEVKARLMLPDDVIMPLFTQFAEQYRDVAGRIQELTGKNDLNAVQEIAHSLKGVSGTLGMKDISKQASEIELYAKDMNADAVARNIPALAASTVEAVAAINARINS